MVKVGGGCIGATSTVLPNLHSLPSLLLSHRRPRAIHHPLLLKRRLSCGERPGGRGEIDSRSPWIP